MSSTKLNFLVVLDKVKKQQPNNHPEQAILTTQNALGITYQRNTPQTPPQVTKCGLVTPGGLVENVGRVRVVYTLTRASLVTTQKIATT